MPRFILIHPTVWLQYTNVTDRQDRQTDNGLIAKGEPFYKRFAQKRSVYATKCSASIGTEWGIAPIMGVWTQNPGGVQGQSPWSGGQSQGSTTPLKLKAF